MAYYRGLGIGPWHELSGLRGLSDLSMPNPEAFYAMRYMYADVENVQLQLCQPPMLDCPQRHILDSRGECVFHIGFATADVDRGEQLARELGLDVVMRGRREGGGGFSYFDTGPAGVTLMIRSVPPPTGREGSS